jgi:uncharacterized protein YjiK
MTRASSLTAVLGALLAVACSPGNAAGDATFDMPSGLKEISGLAVAGPDSVFTHDDNYAIVYEIALGNGHVLRAFAFGDPTIEGDFEGIATANGKVYLITSDGLIYSAVPVANGKRASFQVYDTGIGSRCEIEGLAEAPEPGSLLVLCKRPRQKDAELRLTIYRWPLDTEEALAEPWLSLPMKDLLDKEDRSDFRPSALEWDPARQKLYVVSGRDHLLLVFDKDKHLLLQRHLDRKKHPQTEGVTVMPDGRLVLSDEGSKTRSGTVAVYPQPAEASPGGKPSSGKS